MFHEFQFYFFKRKKTKETIYYIHSGVTLHKNQNMSPICVFSFPCICFYCRLHFWKVEAGHLSPQLLINANWLQRAKGST